MPILNYVVDLSVQIWRLFFRCTCSRVFRVDDKRFSSNV